MILLCEHNQQNHNEHYTQSTHNQNIFEERYGAAE